MQNLKPKVLEHDEAILSTAVLLEENCEAQDKLPCSVG